MKRIILVTLLAIAGCADQSAQPNGSRQAAEIQPQQQDELEDDELEDEQPEPAEQPWGLSSWEGGCSTGEVVDVGLQIPRGSIVSSYLRVSDGYGLTLWVDAREGVLLWGADGLVDVACDYSGRDAEHYPTVDAVRVVWLARG